MVNNMHCYFKSQPFIVLILIGVLLPPTTFDQIYAQYHPQTTNIFSIITRPSLFNTQLSSHNHHGYHYHHHTLIIIFTNQTSISHRCHPLYQTLTITPLFNVIPKNPTSCETLIIS